MRNRECGMRNEQRGDAYADLPHLEPPASEREWMAKMGKRRKRMGDDLAHRLIKFAAIGNRECGIGNAECKE